MMPTRDWCPEKPKTAPPARQPRQLRDWSCLPELRDRPAESSQRSPALLLRVRTSQRRAKPHRRISNADSFLPRVALSHVKILVVNMRYILQHIFTSHLDPRRQRIDVGTCHFMFDAVSRTRICSLFGA